MQALCTYYSLYSTSLLESRTNREVHPTPTPASEAHITSPGLQVGNSKVVKVSGIQSKGRTATMLLRGSNKLVLEEAERSVHDALCVIRCLVQKRALIPGGAAPEMEVEYRLLQWAKTLQVRQEGCLYRFSHHRIAMRCKYFVVYREAACSYVASCRNYGLDVTAVPCF